MNKRLPLSRSRQSKNGFPYDNIKFRIFFKDLIVELKNMLISTCALEDIGRSALFY